MSYKKTFFFLFSQFLILNLNTFSQESLEQNFKKKFYHSHNNTQIKPWKNIAHACKEVGDNIVKGVSKFSAQELQVMPYSEFFNKFYTSVERFAKFVLHQGLQNSEISSKFEVNQSENEGDLPLVISSLEKWLDQSPPPEHKKLLMSSKIENTLSYSAKTLNEGGVMEL